MTELSDTLDLVARMGCLWSSGYGSDLDVVVGLENEVLRFKAHSFIFQCSPVISNAIKKTVTEGERRTIFINTVSSGIFKEILRFLYTGKVKVDDSNIVQLLHASSLFELKALSTLGLSSLCTFINEESVCKILELSNDHNFSGIRNQCIRYSIVFF